MLPIRWEHVEKAQPSGTWLCRRRLSRRLRSAEIEKGSYLRVEGGVISLYLPAPNLHLEVMVASTRVEAVQPEPTVEHPLTLVLLTSDAYPRGVLAVVYSANFALQQFDVSKPREPFVRVAVKIAAVYRFVDIWMAP